MAQILLINPQVELGRKIKGTRSYPAPLGLLSIGSYLVNRGYSVTLINAITEDEPMNKIIQEAKDAKYVGLTMMTAQIPHALMISDKLKEMGKTIIFGGIHAELFKEQTCGDKSVDYVVYGEGEKTFFELIESLEKGKSVENITGLAYKKGDKVIVNPARELLSVEEIPDPNYGLIDLKRKFRAKPRTLELETSRGCPYQCRFCIDTIGWRRKWRAMPAERVLRILERMKQDYDVEVVLFREENFFIDKKRVEQIADGLIEKKLNIKWVTNVRADCFRDGYIDDAFMEKLKKSGASVFYIGVESGSDKIREYMKKEITSEHIYRSVELCGKYDVECKMGFMIGYPTETRKDMFDTISMINKMIKVNPNTIINGPVPFRPYPGASVYEFCISSGLHEPKTLREWAKDTDFSAYLSVNGFPWVEKENRDIVANLGRYTTLAVSQWSRIIRFSSLLIIPALLCKLRWKLKFFKYPFDHLLYKFVTRKMPIY
ncbi:MAG: B12-binding domain-containing radical SAM protein [Nanoarchaeota archaeon]|nr:B12-binding domain-containing radical SAM protein [Nanoarchaeota archaeon]MBU1005612.1 B12-binding domain-containing radical SAM protein [Nanoarchaeota archaeon]MBU1945998.1 B12-binding domain-containing radical SAM protein [Nanoarchaeota archaeon]